MNEKKKINLFIVDDEPSICKLIKAVFTEYGYDVAEAHSGGDFLDKLKDSQLPDIVLLDVMMPKIDGYEVCSRIKKDDKFKKIKIIMYSALTEADMKDNAKEAGADACITKSVELDELSERIMKLLIPKEESRDIQ